MSSFLCFLPFGTWIKLYNNSNIISEFSSKNKIKQLFDKSDIIICSNLKRSSDSVKIFEKPIYLKDAIFNEAQLPFTSWAFLKLNPKIWLVIFRVLWLFGYSQNSESFKESKLRAKNATCRLIDLAKEHKNIVLVGHGIMNTLIEKELKKQKWESTKKLENQNWSYGIFKKSFKL